MRALVLHPVRAGRSGRDPEDALAEATSLAAGARPRRGRGRGRAVGAGAGRHAVRQGQDRGAGRARRPSARRGSSSSTGRCRRCSSATSRSSGRPRCSTAPGSSSRFSASGRRPARACCRSSSRIFPTRSRGWCAPGPTSSGSAAASASSAAPARRRSRPTGGRSTSGSRASRTALGKVMRTRGQHRAARKRVPTPVVALVGYTNAGKSTLFNRLTGSGVLAKDMLFATLDPTMRGIALPTGGKAILSDTVGFISDLPTQLVAAFRATLEEVVEADLDPARARHLASGERAPGRERACGAGGARHRAGRAGADARGLEQGGPRGPGAGGGAAPGRGADAAGRGGLGAIGRRRAGADADGGGGARGAAGRGDAQPRLRPGTQARLALRPPAGALRDADRRPATRWRCAGPTASGASIWRWAEAPLRAPGAVASVASGGGI